MDRTAVIYDGTPGERLATGNLTVVGTSADDLPALARRLAEAGWNRIELCGGVDIRLAAAARDAVPPGTRVGLNRYGFESLELAADFKRAFGRGENVLPSVFLVPEGVDRVDHPDVSIIPVGLPADVERLAAELADRGTGLIELYAGLGTAHAAAAVRGARNRVPVGVVGYDD